MTTQLDSLKAWCRTSRPTDVTAVTGIVGIGKTRLITELMHRLGQPRPGNPTARGWTGGFLADTPIQQPPHYRMLATSKYALLLAVDYAETRRDHHSFKEGEDVRTTSTTPGTCTPTPTRTPSAR